MKNVALVHFNHQTTNGLIGWPNFRVSKWKPNYGDMLVCSAIIRQIGKTDKNIRVAFGNELTDDVDVAIIRGSTYLHHNFDFEAAIKTIDSINDTPLAIVGLGAQHPTKDVTFLDNQPKAIEFIKKISEKSKSISVRGEFTADILQRHGAKNLRITGCPSMFYSLECPEVSVPTLLSSHQRRIGVSLHTGLIQNIFCRAPKEARELHGQVINFAIRNSSSTFLYEQGVELEFNVADKDLEYSERINSANEIIKRINAERFLYPEDLTARMVSVRSIEEWLAKARDQDCIIGFRFHGNMIALLQGIPCLYYTYDSRLEEFCEIYKLPCIDVASDWVDPIKTMLDFDWSKTNNAIAKCYEEIKSFYTENNVQHILP